MQELREGSRLPRARAILDTIATIALVAACGVLIWVNVPRLAGSGTRPTMPLPEQPVSLAGAALKGSSTAKVALIEFADYQCPFCSRFVMDVLPVLEEKYIRAGTLRLALRNLPLVKIHPLAFRSAEAAECAALQGKHWEMHDWLMTNEATLDNKTIHGAGQALGLRVGEYATCMSGQVAAKVRSDMALAERLGIRSTPTFLIGFVLADGTVKVEHKLAGSRPISEFQQIIDDLIDRSTRPR